MIISIINCANVFSADNTEWQPTAYSRICSTHFIGGQYSKHPQSPSYSPTLFPVIYKQSILPEKSTDRFDRHLKRSINCSSTAVSNISSNILHESDNSIELQNKSDGVVKKNVSIQCSSVIVSDTFEFCCEFFNGSVSTQANIVSVETLYYKPVMVDSSVGCVDSALEYFYGYQSIKNEKHLISIAGINQEVFNLFLTYVPEQCHTKKSKEDRLLLCLVKIKLGITFTAISIFFKLHRSSCSRIFKYLLFILVSNTKSFVFWPSKQTIISTLPKAFKLHYPNCRAIIDCTEIKTEQPPSVNQRVLMYSNYKSAYTCKFLIAIAPNGMITFVSKAYGGRSSDSFITNDSGFLNLLEPGDEIMADKGFPGIKTAVGENNSILVMPPFMHNGMLTQDEIINTYQIASVRIHVERSIQRVKIYNILQKIPTELLQCIDDIIFLCCVMTNLQPPIIKAPF